MNTTKNAPTKQSQIMLETLQNAVTNALEKKRKLGQYAVTWDGNKINLSGDDAPKHT